MHGWAVRNIGLSPTCLGPLILFLSFGALSKNRSISAVSALSRSTTGKQLLGTPAANYKVYWPTLTSCTSIINC